MLDTMRPSRAVWALCTLLSAACANGSGGADLGVNEEALRKPRLHWETFEDPKGTEAVGTEPIARLIRSEKSYQKLFGHGSPDIDWDDEVVLFYSAGQKNTGGYRVQITDLDRHGRHLHVTTTLVSPGPDCVVTQALTIPSVLARVRGAEHVRKARFEHTEQVDSCEPGTPCGGLAGVECPGLGMCDQDDPSDECDPSKGADCPMLCSCPVIALCVEGLIFDDSPAVCDCVPDPSQDPCAAVRCKEGTHCEPSDDGSVACVPDEPSVFCGGFAGIECPGLGQCEDDPNDSCDPEQGGYDCGGYCTCTALAKCLEGYVFDSSPQVCSCVEPTSPCALIDCHPGAICEVHEGEPICVSNGSWQCGPNVCAKGDVCCNESCGICTPPDGVCTQQACSP